MFWYFKGKKNQNDMPFYIINILVKFRRIGEYRISSRMDTIKRNVETDILVSAADHNSSAIGVTAAVSLLTVKALTRE